MFEWDLGFEFLQAYSQILCYQKKKQIVPTLNNFKMISSLMTFKYLCLGSKKQSQQTPGKNFQEKQ